MRKSSRNNLTRKVLSEVHGERIAQHAKWGEQNHNTFYPGDEKHVASWYKERADMMKCLNEGTIQALHSLGYPEDRNCTWDTILREEVYEALSEIDPQKRRAELVQVAAVAVAMIEHIDREEQK